MASAGDSCWYEIGGLKFHVATVTFVIVCLFAVHVLFCRNVYAGTIYEIDSNANVLASEKVSINKNGINSSKNEIRYGYNGCNGEYSATLDMQITSVEPSVPSIGEDVTVTGVLNYSIPTSIPLEYSGQKRFGIQISINTLQYYMKESWTSKYTDSIPFSITVPVLPPSYWYQYNSESIDIRGQLRISNMDGICEQVVDFAQPMNISDINEKKIIISPDMSQTYAGVPVGTPVNVSFSVLGSDGQVDTSFNDYVALSAPVPLSPSRIKLTHGAAQENITFYEPFRRVQIEATSPTLSGKSNQFAVTSDNDTGSLAGVIRDSNGAVVANATVVLSQKEDDTTVAMTQTDANGEYKFAAVPAGEYYIDSYASDANAVRGASVDTSRESVIIPVGHISDHNIVWSELSGLHPVVIVPGIMGSTLSTAEWIYPELPKETISWTKLKILNPSYTLFGIGVDDPVGINALYAAMGNGYLFMECPYDWRDDITGAPLKAVKDCINAAKKWTNQSKVDIVAHSMGGIVSRLYIESYNLDSNSPSVDRFVMVGTPNKGSSNVYSVWEGGDPFTGDLLAEDSLYFQSNTFNNLWKSAFGSSLFEFEFIKFLKPKKYNASLSDVRDFTHGQIPSSRTLMPISLSQGGACVNCLTSSGGGTFPVQAVGMDNITLSRMNMSQYIHNNKVVLDFSKLTSSVKTKIFGANVANSTIARLNVSAAQGASNLFPDGVAKSVAMKGAGDGTVLYDSVCLPGFDCSSKGEGTHSGLIKVFASDIAAYLSANRSSRQSAPSKVFRAGHVQSVSRRTATPAQTLTATVNGGAAVNIADGQGQRLGYDDTADTIYHGIANGSMVRTGNTASISLPVSNGNYTIDVEGHNSKIMSLLLNYKDDSVYTTKIVNLYNSGSPVSLGVTVALEATEKLVVNTPAANNFDLSGNVKNNKFVLSWPSQGTGGSYKIFMKDDTFPYYQEIASVGGDATTYLVGATGVESAIRSYVVTYCTTESSCICSTTTQSLSAAPPVGVVGVLNLLLQ